MIRILYVCGGVLDRGGITSYLMNYYRHLDKSQLHIDFLTQGSGENAFVEEIEGYNGRVYQIPNKGRHFFKNLMGMRRIIKQGNYDIVHAHADCANGLILKIARRAGVKVRISHSHGTGLLQGGFIKRVSNGIQRKMIKRNATELWGCSKKACEWLYPNATDYTVIRNGVDFSKFQFDEATRARVREELGLEEKEIALCQVGHLYNVKNQAYSLKIVKRLLEQSPTLAVKIFFIGDGEDKDFLRKTAEEYGINERVVFMGVRSNVFELLNGMDVLLQPSLFEGLPVTLVESQVSGVFCIASSTITPEVRLNETLLIQLDIAEDNVEAWVSAIVNRPKTDRTNAYEKIERLGYNVRLEAEKLQEKYRSLVEKE